MVPPGLPSTIRAGGDDAGTEPGDADGRDRGHPAARCPTGNRGIVHSGHEIVRFHASDLWITGYPVQIDPAAR